LLGLRTGYIFGDYMEIEISLVFGRSKKKTIYKEVLRICTKKEGKFTSSGIKAIMS
jgi:hypothetical protein